MNRTLTTLLVWILLAVLPFHAVAAAANLSCAPVAQPGEILPLPDHTSHHASADAYAHHGAHGADEAAVADDNPHHAEAGKSTHTSFSACSAFCSGAVAPPSISLPLPAFDGSEPGVASPADFVAGYIPDGPQRPPRQ